MRKLFLFLSLAVLTGCIQAQDHIIQLPIPHYRILKPDSTYTTWNQLKKDKPVMIIYFAPDCPHCQHLMGDMEQHMADFKKLQIVMICATRTEFPYMNLLRDFNRNFKISSYKNITIGTEYPDYKVVKYYQVLTTPFIAIYKRDGKMLKYFNKPPKITDLIAAVKKV